MTIIYTCGIIEESLDDTSILSEISAFLHTTREQALQDEEPPTWHIHEYHFPEAVFEQFIPELRSNVKESWYIHAFNVETGKLYVILKDKSFLLPTERDETWDPMIAYGESVGCEARWTENIPLSV